MKKLFLILLFTVLCRIAYNQVVKGVVLENGTNFPVIATIYFNGTFAGTLSDSTGNFELDISKYSLMSLSISAVGYNSVTLDDYQNKNPLIIYLTPKIFELKEVAISSESLAKRRIANLNLFKKIFLGSTKNGRSCKILNENDITFNYNSDRDTLKVFASKPILIDNVLLGYKMTYYLERFEYCKKDKSVFYAGSLIFNDDLAIDKSTRKLYRARRKEAFFGSRMHFLRALWENDLESAGFIVEDSRNEQLDYKDIVEDTLTDSPNNHTKYLKYSKTLYIYYDTGITTMSLLKQKVYFDKDGYYDQTGQGIRWEGNMMNRRVGDMLPYTYNTDKDPSHGM
jgi:hypothetical protein